MSKESKIVSLDDPVTSPDAKPNVSPQPVVLGSMKVSGGVDQSLSGRKVRVNFFEQEGDVGKLPIFGAINGVSYNIPRGVPVDIPVELLEVFNNAKIRSIETLQGGGMRERDMMRFSVEVIGLVGG